MFSHCIFEFVIRDTTFCTSLACVSERVALGFPHKHLVLFDLQLEQDTACRSRISLRAAASGCAPSGMSAWSTVLYCTDVMGEKGLEAEEHAEAEEWMRNIKRAGSERSSLSMIPARLDRDQRRTTAHSAQFASEHPHLAQHSDSGWNRRRQH